MKDNWGWLGPLLIALLVAFAQVYSLIGRVEKLEEKVYVQNVKAIKLLNTVDNRLSIVESYCCEEALK